ncbi:MAG: hypothetical protein AAFU79_32190 [Myxococcota bacterium]
MKREKTAELVEVEASLMEALGRFLDYETQGNALCDLKPDDPIQLALCLMGELQRRDKETRG